MWIGCFGELVFSVSSRRIFTPDGISGSTGSEWATHNVIGGKPKSEMTGAKLKKYKFTVTLDSKLGEPPRIMLALIHKMVEEGRVDYLIIGSIIISLENKIPAIIPDTIAASATVSVSIIKTLAI